MAVGVGIGVGVLVGLGVGVLLGVGVMLGVRVGVLVGVGVAVAAVVAVAAAVAVASRVLRTSAVQVGVGPAAEATAVPAGPGITSTCPARIRAGLEIPFASANALTLTSKRAAISERVSPGRTV